VNAPSRCRATARAISPPARRRRESPPPWDWWQPPRGASGAAHAAQQIGTPRACHQSQGEATRAFDARAEEIALAVARQRLGAFTVFSEEAGTLTIGAAPQWTLVLDPCDGSNNFRRGIRAVGFAVAALPAGAPLDPARVEYAVCGDVFTGAVYAAARGQGATLDGRPIQSAATVALERAVVGVNLGRERPTADAAGMEGAQAGNTPASARVGELLHRISTLRRTGATVLDLCYVAEGAYDAYVDLRGRLTPRTFWRRRWCCMRPGRG